jgi:hypothetical protein
MTDEGAPIAYTALAKGAPVSSQSGRQFGTVEHVLQIPEEDLFDGIVVDTAGGLRFVDRDQVDQITTTGVTCALSDAQVASLPQPAAPPAFRANAQEDTGTSLHDRFGRMFGRAHWIQEGD